MKAVQKTIKANKHIQEKIMADDENERRKLRIHEQEVIKNRIEQLEREKLNLVRYHDDEEQQLLKMLKQIEEEEIERLKQLNQWEEQNTGSDDVGIEHFATGP